ncbi:hypothetical protein [Schlesneria paludicola]|uniref:hypothetical protein n=1 Tax=Schlesneria paludicola TaxID=360056 RepID=UPI00029A713E|nr:hypothetical protein [Schlesneria paludicola]
MTLEQIFAQPEFDGMTDEQALAYGDDTIVIGGTAELWSYSGVAVMFGDVAAEGLLIAIQDVGLPGAAQVYLTRGMQLSLPSVQDKLSAIGGMFPALSSVCTALKEIGITHGCRWQQWGIEPPTLEQVTAARQAPTEAMKIAALLNEFITPYVARPDATLSGLLAVITDATK